MLPLLVVVLIMCCVYYASTVCVGRVLVWSEGVTCGMDHSCGLRVAIKPCSSAPRHTARCHDPLPPSPFGGGCGHHVL